MKAAEYLHRPIIHPVIRSAMSQIIAEEFGAEAKQASEIADKILKALQAYDMEIIKGAWQPQPDTIYQKKALEWEDLERLADEQEQRRNGIRPWNPPELR